MKVKDNFVLHEVAGSWLVVATGAACNDFNGMLSLNESGAMLFRILEEGCEEDKLVSSLENEYEINHTVAATDVGTFLDSLRQAGCLEE